MVSGDAHGILFCRTLLPSLRQELLSESDGWQDQHWADDLPMLIYPLVAGTTIRPFLGNGVVGCSVPTGPRVVRLPIWRDTSSFTLQMWTYFHSAVNCIKKREPLKSDSPFQGVVVDSLQICAGCQKTLPILLQLKFPSTSSIVFFWRMKL